MVVVVVTHDVVEVTEFVDEEDTWSANETVGWRQADAP
jgi:hypothetical protein